MLNNNFAENYNIGVLKIQPLCHFQILLSSVCALEAKFPVINI